jgi:hypothetical protein
MTVWARCAIRLFCHKCNKLVTLTEVLHIILCSMQNFRQQINVPLLKHENNYTILFDRFIVNLELDWLQANDNIKWLFEIIKQQYKSKFKNCT